MNIPNQIPRITDVAGWGLDPHKNIHLGEKLLRRRSKLERTVAAPLNGEVPALLDRMRSIDLRLWQLSGREGPLVVPATEYVAEVEIDPFDDFIPNTEIRQYVTAGKNVDTPSNNEDLQSVRKEISAEYRKKARINFVQSQECLDHGETFINEHESEYGTF